MEKKSTSKKVDKSQEIASCRKSISETTVLLKRKDSVANGTVQQINNIRKESHRRRTYGSIWKFNENDS
jgi:hypothetical protein